MSRRRVGMIAAAVTVPVVGVATFASIVLLNGRPGNDPCRANPVYEDVFSVCKDWTDDSASVLFVSLFSLFLACLVGLAVWALSAIWSRQADRDALWDEPDPGSWTDTPA